MPLHQDAAIAAATLEAGQSVTYTVGPGRAVYLVPATGKVKVGDVEAEARDGLAIAEEGEITIEAIEESEILLSDTPA